MVYVHVSVFTFLTNVPTKDTCTCVFCVLNCPIQDVKNGRANLKKHAKSLEKERNKLSELEKAPEKHRSEIKKSEAKLRTLEVSSFSFILNVGERESVVFFRIENERKSRDWWK